ERLALQGGIARGRRLLQRGGLLQPQRRLQRRDPFLDRAGRRREAPSLLRPSGHRRGRIMVLIRSRPRLPMVFAAAAALLVGVGGAMLGICGPFLDVAADPFCPYVLEIFTLGITTGTTPTTYDPAGIVNRLQMATFVSRTV